MSPRVTRPRVAGWLPRALVLVDQALSSVSNLLAVVLVARVLSPEDFGYFALEYAVLTLTLGLSRAYFGSRISLAPDQSTARQVTGAVVGGMLVIAPFAAVVVLAVSLLATGGQAPLIAVVVACATPVVCIQDALRFGASAGGKPWAALLSDGCWILAMAVPFLLADRIGAVAALSMWGMAAVLALLVALVVFAERPRFADGVRELRRREAIGASLTLGTIATTTATLVVLLVVSRVLGPAATGSLRGASTAMGPVNVLFAFSALGLTPVLVRRARAGDFRFCAMMAGLLAALVVAWGSVLLLLPAEAGRALFGSSWDGIRSVLAWTTVEYVWIAIGSAAVLGLKVRKAAVRLMTLRAVVAASTVLLGCAATVAAQGVQAVAAALAATGVIAAGFGWWLLLTQPATAGAPAAAGSSSLSGGGPRRA